MFSSGDLVAAETEAIGMLRNGQRYHNRYAWIIEIKDDRVCHLPRVHGHRVHHERGRLTRPWTGRSPVTCAHVAVHLDDAELWDDAARA